MSWSTVARAVAAAADDVSDRRTLAQVAERALERLGGPQHHPQSGPGRGHRRDHVAVEGVGADQGGGASGRGQLGRILDDHRAAADRGDVAGDPAADQAVAFEDDGAHRGRARAGRRARAEDITPGSADRRRGARAVEVAVLTFGA